MVELPHCSWSLQARKPLYTPAPAKDRSKLDAVAETHADTGKPGPVAAHSKSGTAAPAERKVASANTRSAKPAAVNSAAATGAAAAHAHAASAAKPPEVQAMSVGSIGSLVKEFAQQKVHLIAKHFPTGLDV